MILINILKRKKILAISFGILIVLGTTLILINFFVSLPPKIDRIDASLTWTDVSVFPQAEGYGSLTPGGRYNPLTGQQGVVIKVTNLNDAGSGSLREAIETKGPRIVVFEVSGIIELETEIAVLEPFLTLAGQTAPGDGICLKNYGMTIMAPNVVVRFIRSRPGDSITENADNIDSMAIIGIPPRTDTYNVVIDHCSLSWSQDEIISTWYSAHDITIQWCIFSEALNRANHPKETHSMGVLVGDGGDNVTLHHNLNAHNLWRNPLLTCASVDYFNNIHYNFERGMELHYSHSYPVRLNAIGNKWIPGTNTTLEYMPTFIIYTDTPKKDEPRIFLEDNEGPAKGDLLNRGYDYDLVGPTWSYLYGTEHDEFISHYAVEQKFPNRPNVTIQSAIDAYGDVLDFAGASLSRDSTDSRIINDVIFKSGSSIDRVSEVGGWSIYSQGIILMDSDNDGIPDSWEIANGLDPFNSSDNWNDEDENGYVAIEEYINSLADHLYPAGLYQNIREKDDNNLKTEETDHFENLRIDITRKEKITNVKPFKKRKM